MTCLPSIYQYKDIKPSFTNFLRMWIYIAILKCGHWDDTAMPDIYRILQYISITIIAQGNSCREGISISYSCWERSVHKDRAYEKKLDCIEPQTSPELQKNNFVVQMGMLPYALQFLNKFSENVCLFDSNKNLWSLQSKELPLVPFFTEIKSFQSIFC